MGKANQIMEREKRKSQKGAKTKIRRSEYILCFIWETEAKRREIEKIRIRNDWKRVEKRRIIA